MFAALACSGRNFDARVEVDLPLCLHRNYGTLTRARWPHPIGPHATKVQNDAGLNTPQGRIDRLPGRHTPGQIRD
jgi:hypothetical protein